MASYWGPQSKEKVNFNFDRTRKIAPAQMDDWEAAADRASQARARREAREPVVACGGGREQMDEFKLSAKVAEAVGAVERPC